MSGSRKIVIGHGFGAAYGRPGSVAEFPDASADIYVRDGVAEECFTVAVRMAKAGGFGLCGGGNVVKAACHEAGVPWEAARK